MNFRQAVFIFIGNFFILSCSSIDSQEEKTQSVKEETKAEDTLKPQANYPVVESIELSWPADDILCDSYEGSAGHYVLYIYRLKETKRVVSISEHGAYCQGDSDFSNYFLYDENGKAVYSYSPGMYAPSTLTLYKNGYPELEILSSGEGNPLEKPIVQKAEGKLQITSEEYQNNPQNFIEKIKLRLASLQKMDTVGFSEGRKAERNKLIDELSSLLNDNYEFKETGVFRKATYKVKGKSGELTEIYGVDIPLRKSQEEKSEITGYVSANDEEIEVIDATENSNWCKIRFKKGKVKEGWILSKHLITDVFK